MPKNNPVGINFKLENLQYVDSLISKYGSRSKTVNHCISIAMKYADTNISSFDTQILKKLIFVFAKANLDVKLSKQEVERIKELFKQ